MNLNRVFAFWKKYVIITYNYVKCKFVLHLSLPYGKLGIYRKDRLSMRGQMDTQYGKVLIDENVIATYAGAVAVECHGIAGMSAINMKAGLVKLLKKDYLNHGINVVIDEDNTISIDFHVIIAYGVSIATVSDNLIETVKYKVETFTGMKINKINIYVEGVRVID